jgi:hypothetical protein
MSAFLPSPVQGSLRRGAHAGEAHNGQADGVADKALEDAACSIDEAPLGAHVARQHHLRAHLQLHHRLGLRQRADNAPSSGMTNSP